MKRWCFSNDLDCVKHCMIYLIDTKSWNENWANEMVRRLKWKEIKDKNKRNHLIWNSHEWFVRIRLKIDKWWSLSIRSYKLNWLIDWFLFFYFFFFVLCVNQAQKWWIKIECIHWNKTQNATNSISSTRKSGRTKWFYFVTENVWMKIDTRYNASTNWWKYSRTRDEIMRSRIAKLFYEYQLGCLSPIYTGNGGEIVR